MHTAQGKELSAKYLQGSLRGVLVNPQKGRGPSKRQDHLPRRGSRRLEPRVFPRHPPRFQGGPIFPSYDEIGGETPGQYHADDIPQDHEGIARCLAVVLWEVFRGTWDRYQGFGFRPDAYKVQRYTV